KVLEAGGPERLLHVYGPTETTTFATWQLVTEVAEEAVTIPIGQPIGNTTVYLLDQRREPVPIGVAGELYVGGPGVARGYLNRRELTAERFVEDRFSGEKGGRLYRTGDLGKRRSDGAIEFVGRIDSQVKIRGFRIELGEIVSVLERHPAVEHAVVQVQEAGEGDRRLVGYVVPRGAKKLTAGELRRYLAEKLPDYMLPAALVMMDQLPLNANGKIDQQALPGWEGGEREEMAESAIPQSGLQRQIAGIWQELLKVGRVGIEDNFFDLGGHSLLLTKVHARLVEALHRDIAIVDLFRFPTVKSLAMFLSDEHEEAQPAALITQSAPVARISEPIAIVAIAGRFPDAKNLDEFWENLCAGRESIRSFTDDELIAAGVDPALLADPNYVKAGTVLDNVDMFDASYFGFSAREAEITDPQHRLFLECAAEALEKAGCDPQTCRGPIGLFAGSTISTYFLNNLNGKLGDGRNFTLLQTLMGNDKDFLATRVSYKLNLKGPSVTVQTACSTSLVAVHMACQSLLEGASDVALAGGVSVHIPQLAGYHYQPEGILSPDGHCRPFDEKGQGAVAGSGVAIVVLKRLSDAQADGDNILAVIRGSAINNDGSLKVGYTAPSVEGQAKVIAAAQAAAGVAPDTVSYVEAHGTATTLGDPIEVAALTQAFRLGSRDRQYCALGSLKSNLGHLDAAAGVAGLIKTVLQLRHKQIVPSLHFKKPNPKIDFANSPFYVNASLRPWQAPDGGPRRAGVSSFGMGGTNAHVVVEEAPAASPSGESRESQILAVSAKTPTALERASEQLAAHLKKNPQDSLADVAYTQMVGRTAHAYRRVVVCRTREEAVAGLQSAEKSAWTEKAEGT
ncbi:MAG TPA: beta-ketoacyl synthase N-terminal-like domain-containing protein, partial [Verrucomicrobiae bacterium]|nr:beta-ketoacyl synthase N-terminal-like domain-containing protein [Verrucomicrobiae bacterium]